MTTRTDDMDATCTPPRLGLLTHVSSGATPQQSVGDTIALCVEAERLGYHSVWVAQHHFGAEDGAVPSPLVLLAAVAMRTSRIRLGTGVITLALEDPVRAAEDAALVDLLSDGRVELGVGSGAHPPTFAAMSRDFSRRADDSNVNLAVLTSALVGDPLPGGAILTPSAASLADRIWRATSTRRAAHRAARAGHGILLARSWPLEAVQVGEVQHPIAQEYRAAAAALGSAPRIGVSRTIVPDTDPSIRRRTAAAARRWARAEQLPPELSDADDAAVLERHSVVVGGRNEIADALACDPTIRLASDVLIQFQPGDLSLSESLTALHLVAEASAKVGVHA